MYKRQILGRIRLQKIIQCFFIRNKQHVHDLELYLFRQFFQRDPGIDIYLSLIHIDHTREQLIHKTAQYLRIPAADILELQIVRQSLDARKKPALFYSYSVNVTVKKEEKVYKDACRRLGKANVLLTEKPEYLFPAEGSTQQKHPTVIIGMGPAGLFCGYYLAQHGYAPVSYTHL